MRVAVWFGGNAMTHEMIQCERCKEYERITGAECEKRMDETGNILCSTCYALAIDTAAGGPIHWATCDALFGLLHALEDANVIAPRNTDAWECLLKVYRKVAQAPYLTLADKDVMIGVENG